MLKYALILAIGLFVAGCSGPAPAESQSNTAATTGVVSDPGGIEIPDPPSVASKGGVLTMTLTAGPAPVTVAGRTFVSNVYNGSYIPPVIRVSRGDDVRITFVNNIDKADIEIEHPQMSNIHYHGMAISPNEPADNPYISIPSSRSPGAHAVGTSGSHDPALVKQSSTYQFRWRVPANHPQGVYWLHSHAHGNSQNQILSGMSGMLVVEGLLDQHYPELAKARRRTLVLKDIDLPGAKDDAPKTKTINGVSGGIYISRPGQVEVWEIGNIGADAFFDLAIDGHQMWVLNRDGNVLTQPERAESVYLPPASRAVIAIRVGNSGRYAIRTREINTGSAGDPNPMVQLGTLVASGAAVDDAGLAARLSRPAVNLSTITPDVAALRAAPIARRRQVVYTETADGDTFFINGKEFNASRIDFQTTLGDVEEWTIVNNTDERHTFHIHQIDFLVTSINGDTREAVGLLDNVDVPFRDPVTKKPGQVTLILPFTDPEIVGKFLFHCHIAEHNDSGMMANMLVKPQAAPRATR